MKAILLAAGFGTRLRPLTNTTPKCLVPIAGKPLLGYWLDIISGIGISEVLINTHYLPDQVSSFVDSYPFSGTVVLVNEPELLGTGGTLLQNAAFWKDDDVLIAHADNFCLANIDQMLCFHKQRAELDASLLVFRTMKPKECGIVETGDASIVTGFHEKVENPPSDLASGAMLMLNKGSYEKYFKKYEASYMGLDLSKHILPTMVGNMRAWHADDLYIDIGNLDTYEYVSEYMKNQ